MSPLISRGLLHVKPQELGKIKIGGKGDERQKRSGDGTFRMPVKYDHFVVTTRVRGKNENFERDEVIHAEIGDKPMELAGVLMFPTVEENFHSEMVHYAGRTKSVSCNGVEQTACKTGAITPCARAAGKACDCKPYSRLHLHLWASPHTGGYHVFRTTSWESTNNIQTALEEIFELFGTLYRAPVKLILYPAEDSYEEGGQTKTSQSYKVGLVLAMSLEEAGRAMVDAKHRLDVTREALRLTSGAVLQDLANADEVEAADIKEEYFPDPQPSAASDLEQQLRGAGAKTVEAQIEEDDEDVPEPTPAQNKAEKASKGLVAQLENLRDKARNADVMDMIREQLVQEALETGYADKVRKAVSELSLALVEARADAIAGEA